jgi:hypothetical protein
MSTTFFCPEAPKTRVQCEWCEKARLGEWGENIALDGEWAELSTLTEDEKARVRCDKYCQGFDEVSEAPEANFSEGNAADILKLLGVDWDYGGVIAPPEIPSLLRKIMVLTAKPEERAHLLREGSVEGVTQVARNEEGLDCIRPGARIIDFGNTDEQTLDRLARLRSVLSAAAQANLEVHWG